MDNKPVDEAIYSKHNNRFSIEFPLRGRNQLIHTLPIKSNILLLLRNEHYKHYMHV